MKSQLPHGLILATALTGAAFATLSDPAHAQLTTYTLSGVSFDLNGSGTVSGSFEYDPSLGTFGSFQLTTSDGTGDSFPSYLGYTYDPANSNAPAIDNGQFDFLSNDGTTVLNLYTSSPVTDNGTYTIKQVEESSRSGGFGGSVNILDFRNGDTGTLTASSGAVPEASTTVSLGLLLMLGMGGAIAAARKKNASA